MRSPRSYCTTGLNAWTSSIALELSMTETSFCLNFPQKQHWTVATCPSRTSSVRLDQVLLNALDRGVIARRGVLFTASSIGNHLGALMNVSADLKGSQSGRF